MKLVIELMFHLADNQVAGAPDWLQTDLYDIEAKADHAASVDELHVMFQKLLIDRFQLRFHREMKDMPAYALTIDRAGSKLKPNTSPEPFDFPIKPTGRGKIAGERVSMSYLTWFLSRVPEVDRPVIDGTGLSWFYDFNLEWAPRLPRIAAGDTRGNGPGPEGPGLFTALREQLGLKLEAQKGPVEMFIIDRFARPSEN